MRRHAPTIALATLAAAALAACGPAADAPASPSPPPSEPSTPTEAAASAIDNCGTSVPLGTSPERIVTVKSTTTELLVALGLGDRIVGAAFLDSPVAPPYTSEVPDVPVISDFLPGQEAVLALNPDAIVGGWESNFAADGVGERDALADIGVLTYVAPSACREPGYQPDRMTFDLLLAHVEEAGAVFGAEQRAAELVAAMQADLDAIAPDSRGLTALWYSSGSDTPYVGAGIGAPQMMMDAAGLTNIMGDVDETWTSATWEAVVAEDPDVIVVVDADWNTAQNKIDILTSSPATRDLTAVRNEAFVVVPFAAAEAGVRNVEAVASIVDQLSGIDAD